MRVRLTDHFVKSVVRKGPKSSTFMDDGVIGFECSSFGALHESEVALLRSAAISAVCSLSEKKRISNQTDASSHFDPEQL